MLEEMCRLSNPEQPATQTGRAEPLWYVNAEGCSKREDPGVL